jgi:hypothetical protein
VVGVLRSGLLETSSLNEQHMLRLLPLLLLPMLRVAVVWCGHLL